MLNNNFSYSQLAFVFVTQKVFHYVHDDTNTFFLFLLRKDFDIFCMLLFQAFLCVFNKSCLPFLYIEKKYGKIFL